VCTTELGRVAHLKPEWEKRNVKVIALSVDSVEDHKKWIQVRQRRASRRVVRVAGCFCVLSGPFRCRPRRQASRSLFLTRIQDIDEFNRCTVNYPIIADKDRSVSLGELCPLAVAGTRARAALRSCLDARIDVAHFTIQIAKRYGMIDQEITHYQTGLPLTVSAAAHC
jgi:hypothetical protein